MLRCHSQPDECNIPKQTKLDRIQYPGGHLSIYFGSQTGTAETYAKQLDREGAELGFMVHVVDLEETNVADLLTAERRDDDISKAVFLCSTYGEGEPTDNSASFIMELKSKIGVTADVEEEKKDSDSPCFDPCLAGLEYCVFGLGNTQYEHYNAMGKFFDAATEKLGGRRIAPIGLGDDDNDIEDDFEKWMNSLTPPLRIVVSILILGLFAGVITVLFVALYCCTGITPCDLMLCFFACVCALFLACPDDRVRYVYY